jgi:hypothetical protein
VSRARATVVPVTAERRDDMCVLSDRRGREAGKRAVVQLERG